MNPDIVRPTLLLNPRTARVNLDRMWARARRNHISFRPHFKTHISAFVGEWFRDRGIRSIAVSSVQMAQYFSDRGWRDILLAFPVNIRQIREINDLRRKCDLRLLVDSPATLRCLEDGLTGTKCPVWIKLDTGHHRAGLNPRRSGAVASLIREIEKAEKLAFGGFLVHNGQTYDCREEECVRKEYRETLGQIGELRRKIKKAGISVQTPVSFGDTPTCSMVEDLSGVNEIRPGNFIFYDLMQEFIGACREEDIAIAMAAPVVSMYPRRREVLIYCGAIHLSRESLINGKGEKSFGRVVPLTPEGWGPSLADTRVIRLSQEHGIIRTTPDLLNRFSVGGLIGILPVHACLTVNLMRGYRSLQGRHIPTMNREDH